MATTGDCNLAIDSTDEESNGYGNGDERNSAHRREGLLDAVRCQQAR